MMQHLLTEQQGARHAEIKSLDSADALSLREAPPVADGLDPALFVLGGGKGVQAQRAQLFDAGRRHPDHAMAQQQAQLTGSVEPLLAALKSAEVRINRAAQPRLTQRPAKCCEVRGTTQEAALRSRKSQALARCRQVRLPRAGSVPPPA